MRRLLWTAWAIGLAFAVLVLACLPVAVVAGRAEPRRCENRQCPKCLHDSGQPAARIAVFGDTQKGIGAFRELAERAKAEKIDLAIHTGDLVSHADRGHYDFALKWVLGADMGVPFVLTPGNHDIKGGNGLFEDRVGQRQFAFPWGPVYIVVVDNAVGPPDEAAVEKMLVQSTVPILLFMHVPPIESPATEYKPKPAYASFLRMIRKYPVLYVFTGHAHGYSRIQHENVIFISNGVGGDSDSWQFDQKAYLTIVEASRESIKAREIVIDPVFSLRANIEHLAIGHVGEIVLRRAWGIPALVALIVVLIVMFRLLRRKKTAPPPPPPPGKFTPAKVSEPPDVVI